MRDRGPAGAIRGVGLGLVMLAALAGTGWAQGDASATNPQATSAQANPFGLPHQMTDESVSQALESVQIATTAPANRMLPEHLRYELKMVDYKGGEHSGSFEIWNSPAGHRTDIQTDAYRGTEVLPVNGGAWVLHDGPRPLRVSEFATERVLPMEALAVASTASKGLKARKAKGANQLCGGDGRTTEVCFDAVTGFLSEARLDELIVEYEGWKLVGARYLAEVVRVSQDKHLLVEAKLTVASEDVPEDAFTVPLGAIEVRAGTSAELFERPGFDPAAGIHRVLRPGAAKWQGNSSKTSGGGNAQVKVWVNEQGRVTKAELEDADDKDIGESALGTALATIYAPYMVDGKPTSFQWSVYSSISYNWSMRATGPGFQSLAPPATR